MNKSCVRRLPGSRHGGGCVCWAPWLAGKGQLQTPRGRGVAPFLLMGPSRTKAFSGITTGLSQAKLSHYFEGVSLLPAQEPGPSQAGSVPLLTSPPTAKQPIRRSWQGNTSSAREHRRERSVPRQADSSREEGMQHTQLTQTWTSQPECTCGHTQRGRRCHAQHTHTGPHRRMHMGLRGHTQTYIHTPAAHPPSVRVGAALHPIWCPDPAGLSRVWLWGGAGASVAGVGLSASMLFPPSKDTYHTPVRSCPSVEPGTCTGPAGSELLCSSALTATSKRQWGPKDSQGIGGTQSMQEPWLCPLPAI